MPDPDPVPTESVGADQPSADTGRLAATPPPARRRDAWPLAWLAGLIVLALAAFYLFRHTPFEAGADEGGLADLRSRVATLEARPAVDLTPLEQRLRTLEQAVAAIPAAAPAAPAPDFGPIEARLDKLEARPVPTVPPTQLDLGQVGQRLDAIAGRQDQLAARQQADAQAATTRAEALTQRLDRVEAQVGVSTKAVGEATNRTARTAQLQAVAVALEAGQKLPNLPSAPPALARFTEEAPPTEAGLRLSFPAAADAARAASQPAVLQDQSFWRRLWLRAQQTVTVRDGDRVVVGDPISGVLAHARRTLDAGDLAGTVAALDGLAGPAAEAMQPWRDQAQALLDARAALANLARG